MCCKDQYLQGCRKATRKLHRWKRGHLLSRADTDKDITSNPRIYEWSSLDDLSGPFQQSFCGCINFLHHKWFMWPADYMGKAKYLCFLKIFLRHLLLPAVITVWGWVRLSLCKLSPSLTEISYGELRSLNCNRCNENIHCRCCDLWHGSSCSSVLACLWLQSLRSCTWDLGRALRGDVNFSKEGVKTKLWDY